LCPDKWISFNFHCYRLFKERLPSIDAELKCRTEGAHLTSIQSVHENEFVRSIADRRVWIGGSDLSQEGMWTWYDGSAWKYTNWVYGEPNGDIFENCIELLEPWHQYKGEWNDQSCTEKFAFVCKI